MKSRLLFVFACAIFTGPAFAEENPCAADAKKFCAGMKPRSDAVIKCFHEHDASLSPACRASGEKMREKFAKSREACKNDVTKFCTGVSPAGGGIVKCLKEHQAELSAECKAAAPKRD